MALDLGATGQARPHLAGSLQLSQATGSRIGVARGLEAFAALAVDEHRPELAVQLVAAASALREAAGLPPLPGARAERYLAPARRLGDAEVARLWARGQALSSEEAVALALEEDLSGGSRAPSVADAYEVAAAPPSSLTRREQQIAALIAAGHSNKAIAEELCISPTTAARHVANILAKLGFRSRTQIAAWVADRASAPYPGERAMVSRRAGLQGMERFGQVAGQGYLTVQPGDTEQPPGLGLGTDHVKAHPAGRRQAGRGGQGPQPGRVDEADLVQVSDQREAAGRQSGQALAQLGHGGDVDLSGHGDDHVPRFAAVLDGKGLAHRRSPSQPGAG